jgi:hypothetical protein
MGGPWRERGFDVRALRAPRPREPRTEIAAPQAQPDWLTRIIVAYIAAVVATFGLMLSMMHSGW